MKRIAVILTLAVTLLKPALPVYASDQIWQSSHTVTADTNAVLCSRRGIFHAICVNDSQGGTGTISLYNSKSGAVNAFAVIRATAAVTQGCPFYDVEASSGLVYNTSVAGNDITMMYHCY